MLVVTLKDREKFTINGTHNFTRWSSIKVNCI